MVTGESRVGSKQKRGRGRKRGRDKGNEKRSVGESQKQRGQKMAIRKDT
jgi:hypothetical protein